MRITRAEVLGGGGDEVEEAGATVEFGEKDGGVGLRIRGGDPLKTRSDNTVMAAAFAKDPAAIAAHSHNIKTFVCEERARRREEGYLITKEGEGH